MKDGCDEGAIRLLVNGSLVSVPDAKPTYNLLTFLRNRLQLTGSKEGCAEGDCGACTVVVGELIDGQLKMGAVNACIQWLPALDGKAVFTVEYLRQSDGALHPTQQSMVNHHGSQCGFCTPGFVMSLWQLYNDHQKHGTRASESAVCQALSGNLCRCTGYRPIIEAGLQMFDLPEVTFDESQIIGQLQRIARSHSLHYEYQGARFLAPKNKTELTQLRKQYPQATLLAGCTDTGLWVNKQLRELGDIIYVGQVNELQAIERNEHGVRIGAGVSLTNAYEALLQLYPALQQMYERFASVPIRNAGTLGGNVANGSPIGDSMPWLIAVGARVILGNTTGERSLLLEDYYLDYMKTALQDDEVVLAIEVPAPAADTLFRTYKLSKRFDSDISAVCGAFSVKVDSDGIISNAVIAFGGMAAIPKRAQSCEQALHGRQWNESTVRAAQTALVNDYQPLTDMRASSNYRMLTAQNLLYRFLLETRSSQPMNSADLNLYEMH